MSLDSKYVIKYVFLNAVGQPLSNVNIAILHGDVNGYNPVTSDTQPGSPLATIYGDPAGLTQLTNPTTAGTNTVTTDGLGNLCSVIDGVTTIGIYVSIAAGSGQPPPFYVIQAYGPPLSQQVLIPVSFPGS